MYFEVDISESRPGKRQLCRDYSGAAERHLYASKVDSVDSTE